MHSVRYQNFVGWIWATTCHLTVTEVETFSKDWRGDCHIWDWRMSACKLLVLYFLYMWILNRFRFNDYTICIQKNDFSKKRLLHTLDNTELKNCNIVFSISDTITSTSEVENSGPIIQQSALNSNRHNGQFDETKSTWLIIQRPN